MTVNNENNPIVVQNTIGTFNDNITRLQHVDVDEISEKSKKQHLNNLNHNILDKRQTESRSPEMAKHSRVNKLPRIKVIFNTVNWFLPDNLEEANSLNDKITFFYDSRNEQSHIKHNYNVKNPFANNVKIKYDPKVYLNFEKLLQSSKNDPITKQVLTNDDTGYEFLDNFTKKDMKPDDNTTSPDMEFTYKAVYPVKKKNYSHVTPLTIPTRDDRLLFKSLLLKSKGSRFINSNIVTTFPHGSKKLSHLHKPYKSSNMEYVSINNHEIKTLYPSPYPERINKESIIYICELCLSYTSNRYRHYRHKLKCNQCHLQRPPGNEIYRDDGFSIFEVDGREYKKYAQNLCLLSMCFLKSKTLYYEVEPFIFYVLYQHPKGSEGLQLIGYFSKEKSNSTNYNLSCILTLPTHRRQGYGFLLMDFSYLLSKREFKQGTPEKPLSDLGLVTYRTFWKIKCLETLIFFKNNTSLKFITLEDMSDMMGMSPTDVILGLEQLRVLFYTEDEVNRVRRYAIIINDWESLMIMYNKWKLKNPRTIKPEKLLWKPMIFGPSCGVNAINTNLTDTLTGENSGNGISTGGNNPAGTEDIFNKHINLITNFMIDDIDDDHTNIEVQILNKLQANNCDVTFLDDTNNNSWKLCFKEPKLNISTVNKLRNKFKQNNETVLLKQKQLGVVEEDAIEADADREEYDNSIFADIDIDNNDDDDDDEEYSENDNEEGVEEEDNEEEGANQSENDTSDVEEEIKDLLEGASDIEDISLL